VGVVEGVRSRLRRVYQTVDHSVREWLAKVNEAPIFVLGNQKSGTTAIAVLLAERAGLSVTWDLTMNHNSLVRKLYHRNAPIEALVEQAQLPFSKDVIKDPNLTFLYEPLRERFPRAMFVMVMRDPRENIRSMLDRLDLPGDRDSLTPGRIDGMAEGWKWIVKGQWMGLEGETYVDRLAGRWKTIAQIYLKHQGDIEIIRYEDFCQAKVESIDKLVSRLGYERFNSIEEKVDHQFQPRGHRRDVDWLSFYGETNLNRIERQCAKQMEALGYDDFCTIQ